MLNFHQKFPVYLNLLHARNKNSNKKYFLKMYYTHTTFNSLRTTLENTRKLQIVVASNA